MSVFDYYAEMEEDIKNYLNDIDFDANDYDSVDEAYEAIYDDMFIDDHITGNGSGSYTFSRAEAKRYVIANLALVVDALESFDCLNSLSQKLRDEDWEYLDVTARCYLLSEVLYKVLKENYYNN